MSDLRAATSVATVAIPRSQVATPKRKQYQSRSECSDRSDPSAQDLAPEKTLSDFAARLRAAAERQQPPLDQDAEEAAAMRQHYAQPAGTGPPAPDAYKAGLLRGFYAHQHLLISSTDQDNQ